MQDFKYAFRLFAKTPGTTAIIILTLAGVIGATTAIFSIVNAVFLHPLPYRDPDRLVVIWQKQLRHPDGAAAFDSYRDFETWKSKARSFEQMAPATWAVGGAILTGHGVARQVLAMPAGVDFFNLLGIAPQLGRTFQPDDLQRGCSVVLRHSFWATTLGSDRNSIGKHITLNQQACTILGVMPPGFTFFPDALSLWKLITPASDLARDPDNAPVGVFARLKPGVTLAQAQQEVRLLYRNHHRRDASAGTLVPFIRPLAEQFAYLTQPNLRLSVIILFAAVLLVLLIACVNIANILLGRALVRHKELAVRAALGSGRARLIRQLLTEGLLLSCTGALFGIILAFAAVRCFRWWNPVAMPPGNPVQISLPVLLFTAGLAVFTALAFGLLPAVKASRVNLIDALRAHGSGASVGRSTWSWGNILVAAEVTLSFALLSGAGLMLQSLYRLTSVPLGFETGHVSVVDIELPKTNYADAKRRAGFYRDTIDRLSTQPAIRSAAFAGTLPLTNGRFGSQSITVEGRPEEPRSQAARDIAPLSITPRYFDVMSVPLLGGRAFQTSDNPAAPPVAIVNRSLVQRYFPHENPLGKRIRLTDSGEAAAAAPWLTIVGVVADEQDNNFFREMTWQQIPTLFRPISQDPPSHGSLVVRTAAGHVPLRAAIVHQIASLDSAVAVGELQTMQQRLARVLAYPRFRVAILSAFAGLAILLAGIGIYGVLSQLVSQRLQEFGIRLALGARQRDVLTLVIRQGLTVTTIGLIAGLILAFSVNRFLVAFLYHTKPADPLTLAAVCALLLLIASFAITVPALRASKADPMQAIRYE